MLSLIKNFQKLQKATANFFGILLILTIVFLGATIYLGKRVYELKKPMLSAEAQIRELVEEVGMAIILPQDELPTVAKVADAAKLNNQPFFVNARTGDDILIYEDAKKAILWRPSIRRVVEVSSLIGAPIAATSNSKNTDSEE